MPLTGLGEEYIIESGQVKPTLALWGLQSSGKTDPESYRNTE